jgi:hypothetical protein
MSRACTICKHRNRLDIDVAILRGDSERAWKKACLSG